MIKRTDKLIDAILTIKHRAAYLQENGVTAYYCSHTDYHVGTLEQECGTMELAIRNFRLALADARNASAQMEAAE